MRPAGPRGEDGKAVAAGRASDADDMGEPVSAGHLGALQPEKCRALQRPRHPPSPPTNRHPALHFHQVRHRRRQLPWLL